MLISYQEKYSMVSLFYKKLTNKFDKTRLSRKLFDTAKAVLVCCAIYSNFGDLPAYNQGFVFNRARLYITTNTWIVDNFTIKSLWCSYFRFMIHFNINSDTRYILYMYVHLYLKYNLPWIKIVMIVEQWYTVLLR